jgi:hypothetical protein
MLIVSPRTFLQHNQLEHADADEIRAAPAALGKTVPTLKGDSPGYHPECCVPMTDGGTPDRRSVIEALAKGVEGTACLADTHFLAGLLNHSSAK